MKHSAIVLCCVLVTALAGCRGPVLKKDDATIQIVKIIMTQEKNLAGTVNFPEAVRVATQNAAYKFSEDGPEKILRVHLRVLKISSFGRALMISGTSSIRMTGYLTDEATGRREKKFKAIALTRRLGGLVGAITVLGIDPIKDEQVLAKKLGEAIMVRIYGEEYARTVAAREPTKRVAANFPMSYADARKKLTCKDIRASNKIGKQEANRGDYQPFIPQELPAYCSNYLTE